jgi:hypothetical protein
MAKKKGSIETVRDVHEELCSYSISSPVRVQVLSINAVTQFPVKTLHKVKAVHHKNGKIILEVNIAEQV